LPRVSEFGRSLPKYLAVKTAYLDRAHSDGRSPAAETDGAARMAAVPKVVDQPAIHVTAEMIAAHADRDAVFPVLYHGCGPGVRNPALLAIDKALDSILAVLPASEIEEHEVLEVARTIEGRDAVQTVRLHDFERVIIIRPIWIAEQGAAIRGGGVGVDKLAF